jgi:tetratricopeptide (TPR) repeat protein
MDNHSTETLVFSYNKRAMDYLRKENYQKSLIYLTKAEELLNSDHFESKSKLLGITFNNFGCFYKRTGNPLLALNFLKKALDLEYRPPIDYNNLAGTHLNMCAILSNIGEHSKAIDHAIKAMTLAQSRVAEDSNLMTTLIVSHHNAGIEYENLGQPAEARKMFSKGLKLTIDHFGESHPLAASLKNSFKNVSFKQSFSPLRSTPAGISIGRASAPRASKGTGLRESKDLQISQITRTSRSSWQNSEFSSILKTKEKPDTARFVTGERLQPMFRYKNEDFRKREVKQRRNLKPNVKSLIKELDGENSSIVPSKDQDSKNQTTQDSKEKTETSQQLETRSQERVSIATQADISERSPFKNVRHLAAVVIQKYCRGFLAKQEMKGRKYELQLKLAEEDMKRAKEKLDSLKGMKKNENLVKGKEILPVAFKDKIDSKVLSKSKIMMKKIQLTVIPEENDYAQSQAVIIQKYWRGWKARKEFQAKKKAVFLIQKNLKRHQTHCLYLKIRDAIIFIQRTWRNHLKKRTNPKFLKNSGNM